MSDYITMNYDEHDTDSQLKYQLNEVAIKLHHIFDNIPSVMGWTISDDKMYFLILMSALERLFFLKDLDEFPYYNRNSSGSFETFLSVQEEDNVGFNIAKAPEGIYRELPNTEEMELFENTIKGRNQFLKIFVKNKTLNVYSNRELTWKQLIQLKIMQWTVFEKYIETPEPEVMNFLKAFLEQDLDTANTALKNIFERNDLKEFKLKEVIKAFTYGARRSVRDLKIAIENTQTLITDLENRLSEAITDLKNKNELLVIAQDSPELETNTLTKYFLKHPYIKEATLRDKNTITLYYEAPLIYYDPYLLKKVVDRKGGLSKQILKIFEKEEYELMARCQIDFNTSNYNTTLYHIGPEKLIGHPHIDKYKCFGTHRQGIQKAAEAGNYLGALEQITQGVLNLNFSDAYVVDSMIDTLKRYDILKTWRHKETGVMLSTKEVLEQYEETETER